MATRALTRVYLNTIFRKDASQKIYAATHYIYVHTVYTIHLYVEKEEKTTELCVSVFHWFSAERLFSCTEKNEY